MSITINKVNKFYGPQHALKNISISIKKGEVVGLLGVNGYGKDYANKNNMLLS